VKWLLDTNIVSEQVRPHPNRSVLDWVAQRGPEQVVISTVSVAELRMGVLAARNEQRRAELGRWMNEEIVGTLGANILPITIDILVDWLQLSGKLASKGQTRAPADLLIASTARVHDLIVVSRNARDFEATGIILYDPWAGKTHHLDAS
jgi:toxin FitB